MTLGYLYLGREAPGCLDAADVDDSGVLNLADAVFELSFLFLSGALPPPPGPRACGVDPTADTIGCATAQASCGE